jgi:hypothetical protein
MRGMLGLVGVLLAVGCGSETATSPTAVSESLTPRLQTAHFQIVAGTTPDATLRAAADRLEAEYDRVLRDLNVSSHALTTVRIWQDQTTYFNELTRYFGVRYPSVGYITGPAELRLLADHNLNVNVVHEFIHAVSLDLNARFGNNPRWFWETVALYENGELVDPRTLDYVVRGNFPTLQQLNVDINAGTQIYQLGYVLGDFIVSRYGRASFLRLIDTSADLQGVLGLSNGEFEQAWQSYVRQRYLSQ